MRCCSRKQEIKLLSIQNNVNDVNAIVMKLSQREIQQAVVRVRFHSTPCRTNDCISSYLTKPNKSQNYVHTVKPTVIASGHILS